MFADIKSAASRSSETIGQDALGAAAIIVMLVAGLCLPVLG